MPDISSIKVGEIVYDIKDTIARNRLDELNELVSNNTNIDLYSYGVEWDTTVSSPICTRIGNPLLHKSLPILSAYRGCIALGNTIMYYLNPNDWHYKEDLEETIEGIRVVTVTENNATIVLPSEASLDNGVYVNLIDSVENPLWGLATTELGEVNILFERPATSEEQTAIASRTSIIVGANLSGFDGTVRVHIPKFYGKSGSNGNKRWVRISTIKIDNTWMEIPEMLVDAYRCTVLNTVPESMGYLSTLPINSTISVVNTSNYCRGGNNSNSHDSYLTTDPFRTLLGKPRTLLKRSIMRSYATNADSELLCYEFYKWIFCWAYIIEYANFNSLAVYNENLTSDGYRQGGLGPGITTMKLWELYNLYFPLTPCGYGNKFGNFDGIRDLEIPKFQYTKYSSYLKDYSANSNIVTSSNAGNNKKVTAIKATNDYALRVGLANVWGTITYTITGLNEGQEVIFKEGGTNYSTATTITPIINSDGNYEISWSEYNLGGNKYIGFSMVETTCNITISSTRSTVVLESDIQTLKMPRWRGFDNPFGDIWTNLDGIVIKRYKAGEASEVYTTTDKSCFDDSLTNKLVAGKEVASDGYIKQFDLGTKGEIIPSMCGGNESTYMCDQHWGNSNSTVPMLLLVGGGASDGASAGFLSFASRIGVASARSGVGFRTLTRK